VTILLLFMCTQHRPLLLFSPMMLTASSHRQSIRRRVPAIWLRCATLIFSRMLSGLVHSLSSSHAVRRYPTSLPPLCHLSLFASLHIQLPDFSFVSLTVPWLVVLLSFPFSVPLIALFLFFFLIPALLYAFLVLIVSSSLFQAAPSANISGRPSPTQASHVLQDLNGRIAAVVDGGSTEVGLESTVVDLGRDPPLVLRPGGITLEQLRAVVPDIQLYRKRLDEGALVLAPPTPGLKYRHYSPSGHVMLLLPSLAKNRSDTEKKSMETRTLDVVRVQLDEGHRVGILQTTPELSLSSELLQAQKENRLVVLTLGDPSNPRKIAQNVFAALREMDDRQVNVIIVQGISEENEGYAVMNRLRKAASTLLKDAK